MSNPTPIKEPLIRGGHYVAPFPLRKAGDGLGLSCPPSLTRLLDAYRDLNSSAEGASARAGALKTDQNFTAQGRAAQMRDHFGQANLPALQKGRAAVAEARQKVAGLRAKMTAGSIDKTDAAGALMRQEIRTWLRNMPHAQRNAMLAMDDLHPVAALAIIEAPIPEMSGVTAKQREGMEARAIAALHPAEFAEVAELEAAIDAVSSAEDHATRTAVKECGLQDYEIGEALGDPTLTERIAAMLEAGNRSGDFDEAA